MIGSKYSGKTESFSKYILLIFYLHHEENDSSRITRYAGLNSDGDSESGLSGSMDFINGIKGCAMCYQYAKDTIFWPCHHLIACSFCTSRIMSTTQKCPKCEKYIFITVKINEIRIP